MELDYGLTVATGALIRAMGMVAENDLRRSNGLAQAYGEEAFVALANECGLNHNAVLGRWKDLL